MSEKTFNFACYARYWFTKGDAKLKTQILGTLGKNLLLTDRRIVIDKEKPFFLIEKGMKDIKDLVTSLEPQKEIGDIGKTLTLETVSSSWLGNMGSNHD